ncbi:hypothetical protein GF312_12960, partial [Candidatus Poribacteria bacterium]|nr:hypothetical protein [Candidatus Poribacteria bacterium]
MSNKTTDEKETKNEKTNTRNDPWKIKWQEVSENLDVSVEEGLGNSEVDKRLKEY